MVLLLIEYEVAFFTGAPIRFGHVPHGLILERSPLEKQELLSVSDPLVIVRLIECAVLVGFGRLMWLIRLLLSILIGPDNALFLFAQAAKRIGPVFIQGLIVCLSDRDLVS